VVKGWKKKDIVGLSVHVVMRMIVMLLQFMNLNGRGSLALSSAPPDERCKPESMVGTMIPLEGGPSPFQGGEKVS